MMHSIELPDSLKEFVVTTKWTFAKTMPEWPHEYIVRSNVEENLFLLLVQHIRANGYEGKFYKTAITYFEEDGLVYWTMGSPIEETTIINRCKKEDTYENRLISGKLPTHNST